MQRLRRIPMLALTLAGALGPMLGASAAQEASESGATELARATPQHADTRPDRFRPGFDPERDEMPAPRKGGSIVVHSDSLPRSLNYLIDNSSVARRLQREVHESLVVRNPWTLEHEPALCKAWIVDDALVWPDGSRTYGEIVDGGRSWRFKQLHSLDSSHTYQLVPKDEARVVRGARYTFFLREDVRWHDGKPFDADDLVFTWEMTQNPHVACDAKRFEYAKIVAAEAPAANVARFEFDETYYGSLSVFEALTPLPRHLYDLSDPDNPHHDAEADDEKQGRYVNEHRCNREWIGLGPYRVTKFTNEFLEAERWDGYFAPERGGWIERIRWRQIADDRAAFQALLAGELDFTPRLLSDDYFGAATRSESFTSRFYTGFFYTPVATYVGWNLRRELFRDVRVRRAFGMAFDWDEFARTFYGGLARRVTAEWVDTGPDYDESLEPLPYDPKKAAALLAEAGWIDRDGDGTLDKDGREFEFALLLQAGNKPGEAIAQKLQENLRSLGVAMSVDGRDWPSMSRAVEKREFDAAVMAWVMPVDSDPAQRWHSREVGEGTSNYVSFSDVELDKLMDQLQVELDRAKRTELMHTLQRKLYQQQAYMYGLSVAKRFAISKRIRNFRTSALDPGYSIREWFLVE